jgi:hypothetical protein
MLQFPYQDEPLAGSPPPSIPASATARWRPLIPITIIGPKGKSQFFARPLLDPGADDTIFPLAAAGALDVQFHRNSGFGILWRGKGHPLRFADVELELTDGAKVIRWAAVVGFSPAPIRYPLLGLAGCLQFFDARFRGHIQVVELEPISAFAGTVIP